MLAHILDMKDYTKDLLSIVVLDMLLRILDIVYHIMGLLYTVESNKLLRIQNKM